MVAQGVAGGLGVEAAWWPAAPLGGFGQREKERGRAREREREMCWNDWWERKWMERDLYNTLSKVTLNYYPTLWSNGYFKLIKGSYSNSIPFWSNGPKVHPTIYSINKISSQSIKYLLPLTKSMNLILIFKSLTRSIIELLLGWSNPQLTAVDQSTFLVLTISHKPLIRFAQTTYARDRQSILYPLVYTMQPDWEYWLTVLYV